ncbi:HAD-IC family P-type ATPase [Candidatus Chloroploca sp. M-50]|uniref:HAD-IC family P-type ATPase n=1 Tax=Candidatus Chloroploca mongolica TaxID=2528176 RepID=A0ABS4DGF1_9CHLR|nr:HAD-IC family P-type ATPase [Candidatus Chloroploca mongolica]MBP1468507.1 HAD-IC family P-type ATPase [Candidatus Chloroploca mongolica]
MVQDVDAGNTLPLQGLTTQEVQQRIANGQVNKVTGIATRSYGQILRENVFTFINNMLFGLGLILLLLGRPFDALISAGVVFINAMVSSIQELQAKRQLDQIALLNLPRAIVLRDGQEQQLAPDDVVLGDILRVDAGDQIIVDSVIVKGQIEVDESQLTGESDLIVKTNGDKVFSGSYCVSGSAFYRAEKVGNESLSNQITAGARSYKRVLTPLQQDINVLVRVFLLIVLYLEIMLVLNSFIQTRGFTESVQDVTVVAGLIPNGLFLSIAVAYAISAVRIIKFGVLVQQSNAIESLSNIDTLCVDKTGTLTANRLQMNAVFPLGMGEAELQDILGEMMASTQAGNKTSEAVAAAYPRQARQVVEEVPFSSARKWSAIAFGEADRRGIYALGAFEMLQPYLSDHAHGETMQQQMQTWSDQGLRVLVVAYHPDPTLLSNQGDATQLPPLQPIGLISLSDELRPEARETLERFLRAGVQPKIISGDSPETVAALAKQAGLPGDIKLVSGPQLAQMSESEFAEAAASATIFGRITPQQKESLIKALRARGHYIAMVGDGVNDVLSLKQAHLGIAMQSGSAATRNVADIILTNDSFAVLSPAVEEGQRIVNGMQDVLRLFLTHTAILAMITLSTLMVSSAIFPIRLIHSALITFLAVGVPTPLIALWARPGAIARVGLIRRLLRFLLPTALLSGIFGLIVLYGSMFIEFVVQGGLSIPPEEQVVFGATIITYAQSSLTTFLLLTGLLLVVFVEPPTAWWVGGDELSGDWRPTILAAVCAGIYLTILFVPLFRGWATLQLPSLASFGLILGCAIAWLFLLRWVWRSNALGRFLGVDFGVLPHQQ